MQQEAGNPVENNQDVAMNAALNNATENGDGATVEEKVSAHEHYLIQLLQGFEVAGHAVNRLERFTFAMVKTLIDKEIIDFAKFETLMDEVNQHEDLLAFWGIEQPATTEETVTPDETTDDTAQ